MRSERACQMPARRSPPARPHRPPPQTGTTAPTRASRSAPATTSPDRDEVSEDPGDLPPIPHLVRPATLPEWVQEVSRHRGRFVASGPMLLSPSATADGPPAGRKATGKHSVGGTGHPHRAERDGVVDRRRLDLLVAGLLAGRGRGDGDVPAAFTRPAQRGAELADDSGAPSVVRRRCGRRPWGR